MLNSERFLNAFNKIEHRLRELTKQEKETRFSTLVSKASGSYPIVRQFSDDLKEFADLRNAIVHERMDERVIAEPNDWAVERIEHIASLLLDPPKVIPHFQREVYTLAISDPIARAVRVMFERSFSQIPIYDHSRRYPSTMVLPSWACSRPIQLLDGLVQAWPMIFSVFQKPLSPKSLITPRRRTTSSS